MAPLVAPATRNGRLPLVPRRYVRHVPIDYDLISDLFLDRRGLVPGAVSLATPPGFPILGGFDNRLRELGPFRDSSSNYFLVNSKGNTMSLVQHGIQTARNRKRAVAA